ncbi:MAG: hypothetical protein JSW02_09510 [candidate division WOR-3 bacterium]|nr:MAG: hypothetical protein JSW02_09510 [candidate division WOR-3 bacterium]
MKCKKILLVLTEGMDQSIISEVVALCKKFRSRLFVLFVIDPHRIARLARLTHQTADKVYRKEEEEGWQLLYLVEDAAVGSGVWTSLHFEDGLAVNTLKKYVETYDIDLITMKRKDDHKRLFAASPVAVMGL